MSDADARIAALEAQVARLTAALEQPRRSEGAEPPAAYDRRTLLRRGGLALAAGVVAVPALARPAAAATGDPLIIGKADNTAGAGAVTGLTASNPDAPTLSLANTATTTDPADNTVTLAHPSLRLVPSAAEFGPDPRTADAGDLASSGEMLWYTHVSAEGADSSIFGMVHTSAYANYLEFIRPYRVLDTRRFTPAADNAGRTKIINTPSTAFDGTGKLRGQQTLTLDLSDLVVAGAGVVGNITVAAPEGSGFFTVFPGGQARPGTSNINYGRGQSLANMVIVGLGGSGANSDTIQIFTSQNAHVIFDVFALSVYELGAVDQSFQAPASAAARSRLTRS